jgi:2-polyprenyl-6-methoxyphenol hydroxylase-like FAD-dependent oxidoreductase
MTAKTKRKVIVIGGSLGGLFVGTLLRRIGWEVDIYERSPHDLDSRGGGIVLQPDVVEVFRRVGVELQDLGVASRDRIVYASDGSPRSRYFAPQTQTSWSLIYHDMRAVFPDAHYHQGTTLIGLSRDEAKVTAKFSDGNTANADLLIGADGGRSTVRGLVHPGNDPRYAGYIAWRGLIPEKDVPEAARELLGHFAFANGRGSARHRLYAAREDWPDTGADHDPPPQIRSAVSVVRNRGLPALDTPCSRSTDPLCQGVGAKPA